MKNFITLLIIALGFVYFNHQLYFAGAASVNSLATATSTVNLATINTKITSITTNMTAFQTNYLASTTRYYAQKATTSVPTDSALPLTVEIEQYKAPGGNGWQMIYRYASTTHIYYRADGFGPEAGARTRDWVFVK